MRKWPKHHMDHYDIVHTDYIRHESMNCYVLRSYISIENIYNGAEDLVVRDLIKTDATEDCYDYLESLQKKRLEFCANRVRVLYNKAKFKGIKITNKNKKRFFKALNETFTSNNPIQ